MAAEDRPGRRRRSRAEQLRSPRQILGGRLDEARTARRVTRRDQQSEAEPEAPEPQPESAPAAAESDPGVRPEPVDSEPDPDPEPDVDVPEPPAGPLGTLDDPDGSDLLRRWAEEEHLETLNPERNWSPLIALAVVIAFVVLVVIAFRFALRDDSGSDAGTSGSKETKTESVLDEPAPSLDDLTAEVTVPPGPETGLTVADKGVTIVEDRFDPAKREGTFAAIIDNPNADWLAQGVQVDVQFLDEAGNPVGTDSAFVEIVLPGQRVAVASLFFDAPTVPVTDLSLSIDVARWRQTGAVDGELTTSDPVTAPAEFSGVKTDFTLRSTFPQALTDVGVTAVYRGVFGQIVGGYDTFLDRVEPNVDMPGEIAMLANIPIEQITSTELYPTASSGFVAGQDSGG